MVHKSMTAVISDIHGNRWALKAVLKDIQRKKISKIVNLGDCLYGPLDPAGTAEILMDLKIPTVCGNEDRIIFEKNGQHNSKTLDYVRKSISKNHIEWLATLPFSSEAFKDFFLFHGSPESDSEYLLLGVQKTSLTFRDSKTLKAKLNGIQNKVILCGHDHIPNVVLLDDGRIVVNPGSAGLQAYTDDYPYPHIIGTGSPHARYSVIYCKNGDYSIENILIPYDWEMASEAAARNGRDDWAFWIKTGRAKY